MNRSLVWLLCLPLGVACANTVNVFATGQGGGDAAGGSGGQPSSSVDSGSTTTTASSMVSTATTAAGGASAGGMGPGAGGMTTTATSTGQTSVATTATTVTTTATTTTGAGGSAPCGHDICDQGPALTSGCDPCVTQICQQDPYCCSTAWDHLCVGEVETICNIDCFPSGMGPCGMQYPNHSVCDDSMNQCVLDYNSTQISCAALCASGGGECLGAFNNEDNAVCQIDPNQPYSCTSQQFSSVVCICSQGCGNGPSCGPGKVCSGGQCN